MPAKSEAQRRFIYATKGAAFAKRHHFDNKGKLPEHASKKSNLKSRFERALKRLPATTSDANPEAESPKRRSR